jgi:hypothetical protein
MLQENSERIFFETITGFLTLQATGLGRPQGSPLRRHMIAVTSNDACGCGDCRGKACLAPTQPVIRKTSPTSGRLLPAYGKPSQNRPGNRDAAQNVFGDKNICTFEKFFDDK